ncbi:acyltransferase family protein [Burkholderia sp. JKS000303]|uniref:acyltransferase family protein n=1 Tax=Burkholderia sp. JKS000303 TaxID=1938747 RepID=UPI000BF58B45|nr:acyltransferase [Burkholderia sp. JKS000303]PFH13424.1 peptidoglycan/LPS O-acetylase OafA/YrhL [Burkholderia sp. JKS000303]
MNSDRSDGGPRRADAHLHSIQILRAVAALLVVFWHFAAAMTTYHHAPAWINSHNFAAIGNAGVDLFFVISGFIIFRTHRRDAAGRAAAGRFLQRRALRIYPLYWLWTTALVAMWGTHVVLKTHHPTLHYVICSYLLWPAANQDGVWRPFLEQGWTLGYELYFYLAFAAAIMLGLRRMLLPFLAGVFLTIGLASYLLDAPTSVTTLTCAQLIVEFLLGIVAAMAFAYVREHWTPAATVRAGVLLASVGVLGLFGAALAGADGVGDPPMELFVGHAPRALLYGGPAFMLVLGAVLIDGVRPVRLRGLVFLGDASYSIYLTHGFVVAGIATVLKHGAGQRIGADWIVAGGIVLAAALGAVAYRLVERPVLAFLAKVFATGRPTRARAVEA